MPGSTTLPEFVANVGKSLKLIDKARYERESQQKDMDIAAAIETAKQIYLMKVLGLNIVHLVCNHHWRVL